MNTNQIMPLLTALDDAAGDDSPLRSLLITMMNDDRPTDDDRDECPNFIFDAMIALLDALIADEYATELITELALNHSLCPMHFIDYAICFDDANDECAAIRSIHPSHDT